MITPLELVAVQFVSLLFLILLATMKHRVSGKSALYLVACWIARMLCRAARVVIALAMVIEDLEPRFLTALRGARSRDLGETA